MRTVLAAVGGTPFGEHAVPLAAGVARRAGATLRVVHVLSSREQAGEAARRMADARWVSDQCRRRAEYLDGLVRRLTRAYLLPVTGALLDGADVSGAVCEASAGADLVVMAARNRDPWARFWRGSVTAAVGRHARCPVLLVRGRDDTPSLDAVRLPCDIRISLDGSERAEEAVWAAAALGPLSGAGYDLLHAIRVFSPSAFPFGGPGAPAPLPGKMTEAGARRHPEVVAARLTRQRATATRSAVADDRSVVEAIAGHAERIGADLIALATRGRGRLSRLFRGSVVEELACRVGIPVLLTRTQARVARPG